MEREIMKAIVTHDLDALRVIYSDAIRGNIYVKADLLKMVGVFIKNNSLRLLFYILSHVTLQIINS